MDALPQLPCCVRIAIEGYDWTQVKYGNCGAAVYRLDPHEGNVISGRTPLYLKIGTAAAAREIVAEAARLEWLAPHLPVPQIRTFHRSGASAWLLTTAIPGQNAHDALVSDRDGRSAIVVALAQFLLKFHALPVAACPFNNNHELRMIDARRNIDSGQVDLHDFDPIHEGWTAEQVWRELHTFLPLPFDRVVAHGDFSLGNILIQDRKVTGCIDVGRTGTADPYQDLAILWNDLADFGPNLQARFLDAYGIMNPDRARLNFHLCLDELF